MSHSGDFARPGDPRLGQRRLREALVRVVPQVLEAFIEDVEPAYRNWRSLTGGDEESVACLRWSDVQAATFQKNEQSKALQGLESIINEWAAKHRLYYGWIIDRALAEVWQRADSEERGLDPPQLGSCFAGGDNIHTVPLVPPLKFEMEWDAQMQTWDEFKGVCDGCLQSYREAVEACLSEMGLEQRKVKRSGFAGCDTRHYDWVVMRVVLRQTWNQIATEYEGVYGSTVKRGAESVAEECGIRIEDLRGRQR